MDGFKYYVKPDLNKFSVNTVVAAMGQLFYSMSIAMGIMITYGSYMKKKVNVESSVHQIEIFDTGIAFFSGLMIVPAVFTMSGGEQNLGAGPGLMFVTLPKVFANMNGGGVISSVFFALVFLAALTSSVSLMETIVAVVQDKIGLKRKTSCLAVLAVSVLLGIPYALATGAFENIKPLGKDFLTFVDDSCNYVIMPIVAFLTCIFVGYIIKPKTLIEEAEVEGNRFKAKNLFSFVIKYVAPICIIIIFINSFVSVDELVHRAYNYIKSLF
jgi:NSS family neurotransmitter:Na+ symporter